MGSVKLDDFSARCVGACVEMTLIFGHCCKLTRRDISPAWGAQRARADERPEVYFTNLC
jgi:hypothetical protein